MAEIGGASVALGSAEIHVFVESGECFASPDLIYHYVEKHGYLPPDDFVRAITNGLSAAAKRSVATRLRSIAFDASRVEDRVDAVADLFAWVPERAAELATELIELPECDPYARVKFKDLLEHRR
uniref:DUF7919 family protein n=1 Tax=unclassified Streptomyces TaxID=2593676 RepID=UPI0011B93E2C|nr:MULTISPECIES: hypothetical protein [unclassified Streptomyces]